MFLLCVTGRRAVHDRSFVIIHTHIGRPWNIHAYCIVFIYHICIRMCMCVCCVYPCVYVLSTNYMICLYLNTCTLYVYIYCVCGSYISTYIIWRVYTCIHMRPIKKLTHLTPCVWPVQKTDSYWHVWVYYPFRAGWRRRVHVIDVSQEMTRRPADSTQSKSVEGLFGRGSIQYYTQEVVCVGTWLM